MLNVLSSFRKMREAFCNAWPGICRFFQTSGAITWRALIKYDETDGEQRAASFAYYAFFALFPLILLLIAIGTTFLGSQELAAKEITGLLGQHIPVEPGEVNLVIDTINGVVRSRGSAGVIAFVALAWSALRFFQALVRGVNKAWGTREYNWWRLPIQNSFMLVILASALFLGIFAPAVLQQVEYYYWQTSWTVGLDFSFAKYVFEFGRLTVPFLVLFYGFCMFYKFAPRRKTKLREVWLAAILVTFSLQGLQWLFVLYTTSIGDFNRLYGAFGSVVALLMWIYLSGSIIILGGCLCAAQYEIRMHITDQSESDIAR